MSRSISFRRMAAWRLAPIAASVLIVCGFVLATASASGPAAKPLAALENSLVVPGAFRLPASNGYTLDVVAQPATADRPASLLIFASADNKGVFYRVPAVVTETSMQADLGALGRIAVNFTRSNRAAFAPCGKETVRFDSGLYEGAISFQGEQGYTSVEATAVPGSVDFLLAAYCGEEDFFGGGWTGGPAVEPSTGAELTVRNPGLGPRLDVRKRRSGAAARIEAWTLEYAEGIAITRFVSLRAPSGAFTFDRHLRTATVRPPAPFSGRARFDLRKKAGRRWSGNLSVDLPGQVGVPLNAPALRAVLVRSSR